MTNKPDQVGTKVDDVLAKVDRACDAATKALETGANVLLEGLGMASNLGDNLAVKGRALRDKLAVKTNSPPIDESKKGWLTK